MGVTSRHVNFAKKWYDDFARIHQWLRWQLTMMSFKYPIHDPRSSTLGGRNPHGLLGWGTRGSRPLNRLDVFFSPKTRKRSVQCKPLLQGLKEVGVCWCYFFWDFFKVDVCVWNGIFCLDCRDFNQKSLNSVLPHDLREGKQFQEASLTKISIPSSEIYQDVFTRTGARMKKIALQTLQLWQP